MAAAVFPDKATTTRQNPAMSLANIISPPLRQTIEIRSKEVLDYR